MKIISFSRIEIIVFTVIAILLCFLPYAFTRTIGLPAFDDVGGTIGGVTAPFLSFFGSILVYLALKAQVRANEQVQKQFKKQEVKEFYRNKINLFAGKVKMLKEEINDFYFLHKEDTLVGGIYSFEYKGAQAFQNLLKYNNVQSFYGQHKTGFYELNPKFLELKELLIFFHETVILLHDEQFSDDKEEDCLIKKNFNDELAYNFKAKIKGNFKAVEKHKSDHTIECPENCGNIHGLPEELFDKVDEISKRLNF